MIQRIQSIYLLIAVLISFTTPFWMPEWESNKDMIVAYNRSYVFFGFHFIGFVTAICIFLYKNRKVQMTLIKIVILLNILLLGLLVYWLLNLPGENIFSEKGIGVIVPLVSIVLLLLAHKAIKKDDNLVKSVDRLR